MTNRILTCISACAFTALPLLAQQPPKPKSQKEVEALQKVQTAAQLAHACDNPGVSGVITSPAKCTPAYRAQYYDAEIQAINYVLENFTDTDYKPLLLNMAVEAAQDKGDYAQSVAFGEQAIQADPNTITARVYLAENIAQHTRENDLDKEASLKKVDDYANKALDLLKTADTPPMGTAPDQWPALKKQLTSQAYDALGQAADLRKKYPDAIQDEKSAIDSDPTNPVPIARLAKMYLDAKQYDDAISTADKVLAMNDAPASVKQFAQSQKDAATKMKTAAPASPSAPK